MFEQGKHIVHRIEEAGNIIKEKFQKGIKNLVKKDMADQGAKPSVALPHEQARYLKYCVSLLTDVSPVVMRSIPTELRQANGLSSTELAKFMRYFMNLTIDHSDEWIARAFGMPIIVIVKFKELCVVAVKEELKKCRLEGVPIVGGN